MKASRQGFKHQRHPVSVHYTTEARSGTELSRVTQKVEGSFKKEGVVGGFKWFREPEFDKMTEKARGNSPPNIKHLHPSSLFSFPSEIKRVFTFSNPKPRPSPTNYHLVNTNPLSTGSLTVTSTYIQGIRTQNSHFQGTCLLLLCSPFNLLLLFR